MNRRNILKIATMMGATALIGQGNLASAKAKFHVPSEDHRHELTFMQWPVSRDVHPDRYFLRILQRTIADIANSISQFEPVIMLAANEDRSNALKLLSANVTVWDIPTEDLWCRDSGPTFAMDERNRRIVSHIQFNGWGGKQLHKRDGAIAIEIARRLDFPVISSGLTGEAGGVEHDGSGFLMAHESSWVNNNRNPGLSKSAIEKKLLEAYGAEKMIWSPGLAGEDITDYHIDSLARFTGPGRVLINMPYELDPRDPFHQAAAITLDQLEQQQISVTVIPEPRFRRIKRDDFVASYANYYVCNGAVIAAQFGDSETDSEAVKALKTHYPNREIVTLNVDALGEVGGGIHCATQQLPAV